VKQKEDKMDSAQQENKPYGAFLSDLGIIMQNGEPELIGEKMAFGYVMSATGHFVKYPKSIEKALIEGAGHWIF